MSERKSLRSSFNDADPEALIAWDKRMQELVRMDRMAKMIRQRIPSREAAAVLQTVTLTPIQREWLEKRLQREGFSEAMRLNYYVGCALGGAEGDGYIAAAFRHIQMGVLEGTLKELRFNERCRMSGDSHSVALPLRVNWGGGWSDTPPYCNENGGTDNDYNDEYEYNRGLMNPFEPYEPQYDIPRDREFESLMEDNIPF